MKKNNILITLFLLFSSVLIYGQNNTDFLPYSFSNIIEGAVPFYLAPAHDFTEDIAQAELFEKQGNYPRIARNFDLDLNMDNSGLWQELPNGDRLWRLGFKSKEALFTCLFFDKFFLPKGATFHFYSPDQKQLSRTYKYEDNQGNELFSTEFISGESCIIEYFEPAAVKREGTLRLSSLAHQYRNLPMADDCEVNIACSEAINWLDEKRGVVRILVKEGANTGYCSGSLINNTALDCKRYILTAFHCGVNASAADLNQWKFYFNYEATQCTGQSDAFGITSNVFTGCTKKADSNDNGGDTGSDFLLVQISSTSQPSWWSNVYWNGWNKVNTPPASGSVSIHHPSGDNKKFSQTTGVATSGSWGISGTHWKVHWGGTANGWGVTEPGSSGGPLFNLNGQIVGTLTGGNSFCNSIQPNGQNQPDAYGKFYFHWSLNGSAQNQKLSSWLDPLNSSVTSLNGSYNPCNFVGIDEAVAQVAATIFPNPTNGLINISLSFINKNNIDITVYNVVGQKVAYKNIESAAENLISLDLTNKVAGVYFIHIKTNDLEIVKNIIIL